MDKYLSGLTSSLVSAAPSAIRILVLILVALILAAIVRKLVNKFLTKAKPLSLLEKWGLVKAGKDEAKFVKTSAQLSYYLVILFFLPAILSGLGVTSTIDPISSMFSGFFAYVPNMVAAGLILFVGVFFCKFIKNLVSKLLVGFPIEKIIAKALDQDIKTAEANESKLVDVLSSIVYVLLFIPILTLALETLGIKSLSQPIVSLLDQVVAFIPNILVAAILLAVGGFLAKLLGNLIAKVLKASGVDKYSEFLSANGKSTLAISDIIAKLVSGIIVIFFFVEAINALNLAVLNTIGLAIISYLPAIISSLIILALAIIGGNILASFIEKATSNKVLATVVSYGLLVLAIFMVLEQLNIAQTTVHLTFTMVLGAAAVAFALAFGLGGKDFAAKQLDKLDDKLSKK